VKDHSSISRFKKFEFSNNS